MNKFAVLMDLPEGKLPGYYARIVKELAGRAQLFDRDKELLIVDTPEQQEVVSDVMNRFGIPFETLKLMLVPVEELPPAAEDFGFMTKAGNCYLYEHLVAAFTLSESAGNGPGGTPRPYEPEQAMRQLEEHTLVRFDADGRVYCVIERHLVPLAEGIAAAYGCRARFLASEEEDS